MAYLTLNDGRLMNGDLLERVEQVGNQLVFRMSSGEKLTEGYGTAALAAAALVSYAALLGAITATSLVMTDSTTGTSRTITVENGVLTVV